MVELENSYLLFDCVAREKETEELDYHTGTWPGLSEQKKIYVFVSHFHGDHYSRDIWKLRKDYPDVTYIIDKTVPFSSGIRLKLGITEEDQKRTHRVKANEIYCLPESDLVVDTLKSNDCGVAFFVRPEGKTILHSGDLNMWLWREEGDAYCKDMENTFRTAVKRVEGQTVDLGFLILDPRMGETRYLGMDTWRSLLDFRHVIPIHMWKEYALSCQYQKDRAGTPGIEGFLTVDHIGQEWQL